MSRQSDLILFGPRLAIVLGSEAVSRVVSRLLRAAMRDSGDAARGERGSANVVPTAGADPNLRP